jgi:hypothetical protein
MSPTPLEHLDVLEEAPLTSEQNRRYFFNLWCLLWRDPSQLQAYLKLKWTTGRNSPITVLDELELRLGTNANLLEGVDPLNPSEVMKALDSIL